MVNQVTLGANHVGNRDAGKIQRIGFSRQWIDGIRPRASLTSADDIGTDDKMFIRIEGLAGTDHRVPPSRIFVPFMITRGMGIGGKGMEYQNGINILSSVPMSS